MQSFGYAKISRVKLRGKKKNKKIEEEERHKEASWLHALDLETNVYMHEAPTRRRVHTGYDIFSSRTPPAEG